MIKSIKDKKIYTNFDRYCITRSILHNMIMAQLFKYDKVRFDLTENGFFFNYKIRNISIEIVGNSNNIIGFIIKFENEKRNFKFKGPDEVDNYELYKTAIFEYWDKMLYTIYLCATSKQFKVNSIDEIMKYFDSIYNASICGWR